MQAFFNHFYILVVPLILSNVLHMVIVKYDWLAFLKAPIWEKGFGLNKTYRGLVVVPMLNALFFLLITLSIGLDQEHVLLTGFLLGLCYMLFELPNSFIKRKIGIASGDEHQSKAWLFKLIDKTDSAFGVNLFYYLWSEITLTMALSLFVTSIIVHFAFSFLLYKIKLKSGI